MSGTEKLNFLIVEDDTQTLERLKYDLVTLQLANNIHSASNGLEAIKLYGELQKNNEKVDVIISDIVMPVCGGIEFLEKFREKFDPDKKQTIIMLTSKSDKNLVLQSISFGVSQYLLKPWNHQVLMQKIMAALSGEVES